MFRVVTKILILSILFFVVPNCISPDAVKTEIQGIRNEMGQLEKVADELSVWRKNIEAEVINYGGGGWIVLGTGIIALIFVGAGLLLIRAFMQRGNLLTLLTCAVQKVGKRSPEITRAIKDQLKQEVIDGRFSEQHRKNLGNFAQKRGTFSPVGSTRNPTILP